METVKVHNKQRAEEWIKVLGTDELPIKSMMLHRVRTPIGEKDAYMMDVEKLTREQQETLIKHLAKKFNLNEEEVGRDVFKKGVPILREDCIASSDEIMRYL